MKNFIIIKFNYPFEYYKITYIYLKNYLKIIQINSSELHKKVKKKFMFMMIVQLYFFKLKIDFRNSYVIVNF